jgi:hypothetical protein
MSIPNQTIPGLPAEFQSGFGNHSKTDIGAKSPDWERLCGELLQEREQLRQELAETRAERETYLKAVYYYLRKEASAPTFTKEEVFAHLDDKPTFAELIAELEREYAPEK